jgi:hypothetical protein
MRHAFDIEKRFAQLEGQAGVMVGLALALSARPAGGSSGVASPASARGSTMGGDPPSRLAISGSVKGQPVPKPVTLVNVPMMKRQAMPATGGSSRGQVFVAGSRD